MILDTATKLEAVIAGAVSANQPEVHVNYLDWNNEGKPTTPAPFRVALNSSTDVTILAAPVNNPIREVLRVSIYNKDTASVTLTVKTDDGTTERIIHKETLLTLESVHFEKGQGWYALDANGNRKEVTGSAFSSITLGGGSALSTYVVDTHVTTCTGFDSDPSVTVKIIKIGNLVSLTIPGFTGTSDATSKALAAALAAAYRPAAALQFFIRAADNGGTAGVGLVVVGSDGTVTFYPDDNASNWTASGAATISATGVHYSV